MMLLELISGVFLLRRFHSEPLLWINLVLLAGIWLSTLFLSVPIHSELGHGQDQNKIDRLVKTNWPRTILWSLRLIILTIYFFKITQLNLTIYNGNS